MSRETVQEYLKELPEWNFAGNKIEKEFKFISYIKGLESVHSVGRIVEQENHHPDILMRWRKVKIILTTHAIKNLSENDFIMAAKAERGFARF